MDPSDGQSKGILGILQNKVIETFFLISIIYFDQKYTTPIGNCSLRKAMF
jgi:hypothetical protein